MSLPSHAIWFNGKDSIGSTFINVGWVYSEDRVFDVLKGWAKTTGFPTDEWTHVKIYHKKYTKEEIMGAINGS